MAPPSDARMVTRLLVTRSRHAVRTRWRPPLAVSAQSRSCRDAEPAPAPSVDAERPPPGSCRRSAHLATRSPQRWVGKASSGDATYCTLRVAAESDRGPAGWRDRRATLAPIMTNYVIAISDHVQSIVTVVVFRAGSSARRGLRPFRETAGGRSSSWLQQPQPMCADACRSAAAVRTPISAARVSQAVTRHPSCWLGGSGRRWASLTDEARCGRPIPRFRTGASLKAAPQGPYIRHHRGIRADNSCTHFGLTPDNSEGQRLAISTRQ